MPITKPTYDEIIARVRGDISSGITELDPTIFASFIRPLAESGGGRSFDIVQLVDQLERMMFPQSAIGPFLDIWLNYEGLSPFPATGSSGAVVAESNALSSSIPAATEMTDETGNVYEVTTGATTGEVTLSVTSLTRSGTTVTAVTASEHSFATGIDVDMLGANETEYNGGFTITVISPTSFTYEITGTPATPATGTITADYESTSGAVVEIESVAVNDSENGVNLNLESGAALTISVAILNVLSTVYVSYEGLTGAADAESDESKFNRIMQSRKNPVANFNPAAIEKEVLKIAGVTRVKVKRITPDVGSVTVLFVRDNDSNIIPDGGEVTEVRDALLLTLPAQSSTSDLHVTAPTPVSTDYTFSAISPNTSTMRTAIEANIDALYRDSVTFETDITEDKYRSAIIDTIDPETGEELVSFTLSTPSGDITVTTDEIGVKGTVTF